MGAAGLRVVAEPAGLEGWAMASYSPGAVVSVQRQWMRPQDGHALRRRRSSSRFFASPARIISHPASRVAAIVIVTLGSRVR